MKVWPRPRSPLPLISDPSRSRPARRRTPVSGCAHGARPARPVSPGDQQAAGARGQARARWRARGVARGVALRRGQVARRSARRRRAAARARSRRQRRSVRGARQRSRCRDQVVEDYIALVAALPPPPANMWLSVDLSHLALDARGGSRRSPRGDRSSPAGPSARAGRRRAARSRRPHLGLRHGRRLARPGRSAWCHRASESRALVGRRRHAGRRRRPRPAGQRRLRGSHRRPRIRRADGRGLPPARLPARRARRSVVDGHPRRPPARGTAPCLRVRARRATARRATRGVGRAARSGRPHPRLRPVRAGLVRYWSRRLAESRGA